MKTKHEARNRGLSLAAKITGISALALAAAAMAEARADAATGDEAIAEQAFKVHPNASNCGCAPCWGPPAPPARGEWS